MTMYNRYQEHIGTAQDELDTAKKNIGQLVEFTDEEAQYQLKCLIYTTAMEFIGAHVLQDGLSDKEQEKLKEAADEALCGDDTLTYIIKRVHDAAKALNDAEAELHTLGSEIERDEWHAEIGVASA